MIAGKVVPMGGRRHRPLHPAVSSPLMDRRQHIRVPVHIEGVFCVHPRADLTPAHDGIQTPQPDLTHRTAPTQQGPQASQSPSGSSWFPCVITDISPGGARMITEGAPRTRNTRMNAEVVPRTLPRQRITETPCPAGAETFTPPDTGTLLTVRFRLGTTHQLTAQVVWVQAVDARRILGVQWVQLNESDAERLMLEILRIAVNRRRMRR